MKQELYFLDDDVNWFPSPRQALSEPAGLLAIGGDLSPQRILSAYQQGIFPWFNEDEPIMWWSPDPRAVLNIGDLKINKSLRKFLRKCDYIVSVNQAFEQVIRHCAKPRANGEGTWILPEMVQAYCKLHAMKRAHSIEVWQKVDGKKELIGGLYGILAGNCFCGESMFSKQTNASKLALITLHHLVSKLDNGLIDCQLPNPYLMSMGASLTSREMYLSKLTNSLQSSPNDVFLPKFIEWQPLVETL